MNAQPFHIGAQITIRAGELVAGGAAIARIDGFPIFVHGLYPGDEARVSLTEVKKGFAHAEVVELLSGGPERRTDPCPIAGECGGCDWTSLRLDAQLRAKQRILTESLRRIGKLDADALPPITLHPSPLNYRLRSRLHREGDRVGFYAAKSNDVVQLSTECEVVGRYTAMAFGERPDVVRSLEDEEDETTGDEDVSVWEIGNRLLVGQLELEISVDDYNFQLSTESFFQVNRHLLATMIHLVEGLAGKVTRPRLAIELYAGVGFFTAPISRVFERTIAVEGSPESHRYARRNAQGRTQTVHAPVESWVRRMPDADLIFLDPPRAGARSEVIDIVSKKARQMICYLSCDPVTFSRDANRLTASGWRLATLDLLDLFPNTHHVETLASFERAQ